MPNSDAYWGKGRGRLAGAGITMPLQFEPVRSTLTEAAPIMVNWITPPSVVATPGQSPKPLPSNRASNASRP